MASPPRKPKVSCVLAVDGGERLAKDWPHLAVSYVTAILRWVCCKAELLLLLLHRGNVSLMLWNPIDECRQLNNVHPNAEVRHERKASLRGGQTSAYTALRPDPSCALDHQLAAANVQKATRCPPVQTSRAGTGGAVWPAWGEGQAARIYVRPRLCSPRRSAHRSYCKQFRGQRIIC